MPANHTSMLKWTSERICDWAEKTGGHTGILIDKIIKSRKHPQQAYRSCVGIIGLGKKHGNENLDLACKRANHFGLISYKKIKNILEKGLQSEDISEDITKETVSSDHANIRGKEYYQSEGAG